MRVQSERMVHPNLGQRRLGCGENAVKRRRIELLTLMCALMARVGLRPGEAAGVCGDAPEVDSNPPTVAVLRAVHLDNGRPVLTDKLKTAGERRTLAIPADLAASLGALAIRPG
jgi:hypothetical protein